jgi:hypothetical protein
MLEKWAADDLRSVNAQIEYLLTEAGKKAGRFRAQMRSDRPSEERAGEAREERE